MSLIKDWFQEKFDVDDERKERNIKIAEDVIANKEKLISGLDMITLEYLFEVLEKELLVGKYSYCDEMMKKTEVKNHKVQTVIAILVITYPFRDHLKNREDFLKRVKDCVYLSYEKDEAEQILSGVK